MRFRPAAKTTFLDNLHIPDKPAALTLRASMDRQIHAYNARMSVISKIFRPSSARRRQADDNPPLTFIKSIPQNSVTDVLVRVFPKICDAVLTGAERSAAWIGLRDSLFEECIIDLELMGGFGTVLEFASDKALASAYVDAVVFDLTGKNPSVVPSDAEIWSGGTEKYRGIAKFVMARHCFRLPRPEAHLFGKEYSQIRTGNSADLAEIAVGSSAASRILGFGKAIFDHFLFGPGNPLPPEEEVWSLDELLLELKAKRSEKTSKPEST